MLRNLPQAALRLKAVMSAELGPVDAQAAADREPQRRDLTIADLPELAGSLTGHDRWIFHSVYDVDVETGELNSNGIPMFADLEAQDIVVVHDKRTLEVVRFGLARAL